MPRRFRGMGRWCSLGILLASVPRVAGMLRLQRAGGLRPGDIAQGIPQPQPPAALEHHQPG
eukprot:4700176-Alexandrium_andersonii.AAC.1